MFFFLSKLLDLALSPLVWSLALLAFAIPWRRGSEKTDRRRRRCGIAALAIVLVSSMPFTENAIWWWLERQTASSFRKDVTYDAVILLGGVGDERVWEMTGEPAYNDNVERLIVTRDLLAKGTARVAILSGGVNDAKYQEWNEARMLRSTLRSWGIEDDRILLEEHAQNTRENAVFTAQMVRERGLSRVLVVTSAFHMARAADCFRAVALDVDVLPVDFRAHERTVKLGDMLPRSKALEGTTAALREVFGRWVYRIRGYGKGS